MKQRRDKEEVRWWVAGEIEEFFCVKESNVWLCVCSEQLFDVLPTFPSRNKLHEA